MNVNSPQWNICCGRRSEVKSISLGRMVSNRSSQLLKILVLAAALLLASCTGCGADGNQGRNNGLRLGTDASSDALGGGGDGGGTSDAAQDGDASTDDGGSGNQDGGSSTDAGDDSGTSGGRDGGSDAADAQQSFSCDSPNLATSWQLDSAGPIGQADPNVAFDGKGVWITYYRAQSAGSDKNGVFAVRMLCDGRIDVGPINVSENPDATDRKPAIDIHEQTVYIAFTSQKDGANRTFYRTYQLDGTPIMSASKEVTPLASGSSDTVSNLAWEVDVAALPGGGAIVAASFMSATADYKFQIYAQQVDDDGNRVGGIIRPYSNKDANQKRPSIAVESDQKVWVSWVSETTEANVVYRSFDPSSPGGDMPMDVDPINDGNDVGFMAKTIPSSDQVFMGYMYNGSSSDMIGVVDIADTGINGADIGTSTTHDRIPRVAATSGGGAVAWLSKPASGPTKVKVQKFAISGSNIATGAPQTLPTTDSAVQANDGGLDIAHLGGDVYFVSWGEGSESASATVRGRFVQL